MSIVGEAKRDKNDFIRDRIIFLQLFKEIFCSLNILRKFAIPNRKKWCWFGSSAG